MARPDAALLLLLAALSLQVGDGGATEAPGLGAAVAPEGACPAAEARSGGCPEDDAAALLQALGKARPGHQGAFPDLGALKDLADKAEKKVAEAKETGAKAIKSALLQLAGVLNSTLLEADEKVDSLAATLAKERQEFIESLTELVEAKAHGNGSAASPEGLLNRTFAKAEEFWASVAAGGSAAATAFTGGLEVAGLDEIASEANKTLDKALQSAESLEGSIKQAHGLLLSLSEEEAPRELAALNQTLKKSLQQAGAFAESFAGAFDELYSGVTQGFSKGKLNAKKVASSLKTAVAGQLDEESMLEVKTAFSSVLQTAQRIAGKALGSASDLVSGVNSGVEAAGIAPEHSGAGSYSRLRWFVVSLVPLTMALSVYIAYFA